MGKSINLVLGIHNHQPLGNFEHVFEDAYQRAYRPFIEVLERFPDIKMTLHNTGILYEWYQENHPEFIEKIKRMVDNGQVELFSGGYYEPILPIIPEIDRQGQINKLNNLIKDKFGCTPRGAWIAERVWEPALPLTLSTCGIKYITLDTSHFQSAGLTGDSLLAYYLTEADGMPLSIFPISQDMRYLIPFHPVDDVMKFLGSVADESGEHLVVMADDGEKFGIWPGTFDSVYKNKWLECFFRALSDNKDWIHTKTFNEVYETQKPVGRIYLPTASYGEMMEWALPVDTQIRYQEIEEKLNENGESKKYEGLLKGGFFRNFFVKYHESNNLHKKMLYVSKKVHSGDAKDDISGAENSLWRGQCNCPYWHGVFGGIYLNHLRAETYRNLIEAELLTEAAGGVRYPLYEITDFDMDGHDEIILKNKSLNLIFSAKQGGACFECDLKSFSMNMFDTMTRYREAYHQKVASSSSPADTGATASIHDLVISKEEGLEKYLHYDWHRRSSFIDHIFGPETTIKEFQNVSYPENGDFANQPYKYELHPEKSSVKLILSRDGNIFQNGERFSFCITKKITIDSESPLIQLDYELESPRPLPEKVWFGIEMNFSLHAGDAPDRYYYLPENGGIKKLGILRSSGISENASTFGLRDDWRGLDISLNFQYPVEIWRLPIETVSLSESGFERSYQNSLVLPTWRIGFNERLKHNIHFEIKIKKTHG